jgi:O-antigen ligase
MNRAPHTIQFRNFVIERATVLAICAYAYLGLCLIISIVFTPSPIIYLLLLAVAALFVIPEPLLGLGLIISLTMIFERFFTLQTLTVDDTIYKIYPLDIVIGTMLIGIIAHYRHTRERVALIWQLPEKLLALFVVFGLAHFILSLTTFGADTAVAFSTFKNYALYPLLYFAVLALVKDARSLRYLMRTILATAVALIIFIAIGAIRGEGLWTEFTPLSTEGVRILAGTHAFYLSIATLITISLIAYQKLRYPALTTAIISIWLIGIAGSLMRHLWLALLVALATLFILIPKDAKKNSLKHGIYSTLVIISVICIGTWMVILVPTVDVGQQATATLDVVSERLESINNTTTDTSASWRLELWKNALKAWSENPIIGIGFGQSLPLELGDWQTTEEIRNIHNSPLAILVQMGIIGFGLFAGFVISVVAKSYQSLRTHPDAPYYFGIIAALALLLFSSLFQPYLETNLTAIFLWLLLGLLRTSTTIPTTK